MKTLFKVPSLNLRQKTLLAVCLTLSGLIGATYIAASTILLKGYARLEEQTTRQTVERTLSVYRKDLNDLNSVTYSWSHWDDAYEFVQQPNQAFLDENFYDEIFSGSRVNFIVFFNSNGRFVYGKGYDLIAKQSIPIPQTLLAFIRNHPNQFQYRQPHQHHAGVVAVPEGILSVSAHAIATSKGEGPVRGTLVIASYLVNNNVNRLSAETRYPLIFHRLADPSHPASAHLQKIHHTLTSPSSILVHSSNNRMISGYVLFPDITGKLSLMLEVIQPRVIYQQGQDSLRYLLIALIILGSAFGILIQWLADRLMCSWEAHRKGEARYQSFINQASEGIVIVDAQTGQFLEGNPAFQGLLGYAAEELLNLTLYDVVVGDRATTSLVLHHASLFAVQGEQHLSITEQQYRHRQGHCITVEVSANRIQYGNRDVFCIVVRDITDRKRAEAALQRSETTSRVLLETIPDLMIRMARDGTYLDFIPAKDFKTLIPFSNMRGQNLFDVLPLDLAQERLYYAEKALKTGTIQVYDFKILVEGEWQYQEARIAPCGEDEVLVIIRNISERKQAEAALRESEQRLTWQANHDELTGLVNRREFARRVEWALNDAIAHLNHHTLCYLDLDQFKIINDTCGHMAGDELLRQVTTLLKANVRSTDVLARLGGDEFGLLLKHCSLEQALKTADVLRQSLQEFRFAWQDKLFTIGVSIGVVAIDNTSRTLSDALSAADTACYAAKNKGRNRVQAYQVDDADLVQHYGEMHWVTRITRALEENRFCLYFQTIMPVAPDGDIGEHYEVLLRMCDESGTIIPPNAFIPAAERYNLMHLIDRWVIKTLFSTQKQHYQNVWRKAQTEHQHYLFTINLSGASINDDHFIPFLHEQFERYQIPPQVICFEITETLAIANLSKALNFMREFKQLGCNFALDDFGSGMSSFTYLKNLPVDYLKIDGAFVKDILDDPTDLVMVEAINRVGHVMGLKTIAEFVENDAILQKLRDIGVDYAQGYGIAKPCPIALPERLGDWEVERSAVALALYPLVANATV